MIEISLIIKPCIHHANTPNTNMVYIPKEMLEVSFVRITWIACGTKDTVVKNAAIGPNIAISFQTFIAYLFMHLHFTLPKGKKQAYRKCV